MQLNKLKPTHKRKKRKRVGRGDTYAGLGRKGQTTRAGRKMKPAIREFIKRYPKLRGYRFKSRKDAAEVINLDTLERNFKEGETVSPLSLLEKGLISKTKGKIPQVKILGRGKLNKKLDFRDCIFSKKAERKVKPVAAESADKDKRADVPAPKKKKSRAKPRKKKAKPKAGRTKKKAAGRKATAKKPAGKSTAKSKKSK
jgi:large subunit ribosomal protein L15